MQNFLNFLILVSLLPRIRGDWDFVTQENDIASRPPAKIQNTTITTAVREDYEKFDDYELKKLFVKKIKYYQHLEVKGYTKSLPEDFKRKTRAVPNKRDSVMECLTCFATGRSESDANCYQGKSLEAKTCADAEYCFIEVHPLYLKRGCILPGRVNRTFVCKCPLCNDKPSSEHFHYEYLKIRDWAYDNVRLTKRITGVDLICKVCETKGSDSESDARCRAGKKIDYMVCENNQLCYTNIDDETDFVSRGCINRPAFNSIYFFCNGSSCNDAQFINPTLRIDREATYLKSPSSHLKFQLALQPNKNIAAIHTVHVFLFFGLTCKEVFI